jgi:hypothetical protein
VLTTAIPNSLPVAPSPSTVGAARVSWMPCLRGAVWTLRLVAVVFGPSGKVLSKLMLANGACLGVDEGSDHGEDTAPGRRVSPAVQDLVPQHLIPVLQ